jgi:hypothetical protein
MAEEANGRWKAMMNIWLEGALFASKFTPATRAKPFAHAMSDVAADIFIQIAREQYVFELDEADTMVQAIENYMVAEVYSGLATDQDLFIRENDAHSLEITVVGCPYGAACAHFISALQDTEGFSKEDIPCLRANCYGVAVTRLTGAECCYQLLQVAPGTRCQVRLEVV